MNASFAITQFAIIVTMVGETCGSSLRTEFSNRETAHLRGVLNSTRPLLRPPAILDPYTTARRFVDDEQRGQTDRLVAGILVENFSKYKLDSPIVSYEKCSATREITAPLVVHPGTSELFLVDNDATDLRGVCGTFSWAIKAPDGRPVVDKNSSKKGRRFVVNFYVPWGGSCGDDGRANIFSLNIWPAKLNASYGHWKQPNLVNQLYDVDLTPSSSSAFSDDGGEVEALFDDGLFLLVGKMERGCKPILTVSFLPGLRNKRMLCCHEEKGKPNASAIQVPAPTTANSKAGTEEQRVSMQTILMYSVAAAACLFVVLAMTALVRHVSQKARNRRQAAI